MNKCDNCPNNCCGNNFVGLANAFKHSNGNLFNQILLSEAQKDTTIYIDLTVEAVAYAGNIYKKMENNQTTAADIPVHALPFGLKEQLPAAWTAWR